MKLSNEAKVGIVIFISAIIFFGGVMYLREVDFQQKDRSFFILYDNVSGLKEGSQVVLAGFSVGKVNRMTLAGSQIAVEVSVQKNVLLSTDARAEIKSSSLMGGKIIALTPGRAGRDLANGDTLHGSYQADLTELTSTLAPIGSDVLRILDNVNTTFDENTRRGIKDIVQQIGRASQQVNQVVDIQGSKLDRVLNNFSVVSANLVRFTGGLDTMAHGQRLTLDSSLAAIRAMTENLHQASQNIQNTTRSLDTVFARVKSGQGTLGLMVQDEGLYRHVDSVAINLNEVLQEMKSTPGKYIRFSIF